MSDTEQKRTVTGWSLELSNGRKLFVSESTDHPCSDNGKGRLVAFCTGDQETAILLSDETVRALRRLWRHASLRDRLRDYCWTIMLSVLGRD